ncbi:peptidoglycan DD-metalloendopeptidase family protein, partial [Streptomyces sp. NPDC087659]|uniref:peptidoglycan DD-metalloendopeptidase family protein n=1 Tax=Streptomyces sp. NPDC087659 TaxID=3365801 RepID=UPI003802833F
MNRARRVVKAMPAAVLLVLLPPVAAWAAVWPVGPPRPAVVRGWEPPPSPYGRGHRGADLAAPPGTEVRAAAPGRVSFAGPVAGRGVLSIALTGTGDPPLRTTYEPVRPLVEPGALVTEGQVVAVVAEGSSHCPRGCLHWGLRRGEEYLDPLSLLPASALRRGPSRLLPVFGVPVPPSSAPEVAGRRLAEASPAPSRAGADTVQALVLTAAAVLSHRALRYRRRPGPEGRARAGLWPVARHGRSEDRGTGLHAGSDSAVTVDARAGGHGRGSAWQHGTTGPGAPGAERAGRDGRGSAWQRGKSEHAGPTASRASSRSGEAAVGAGRSRSRGAGKSEQESPAPNEQGGTAGARRGSAGSRSTRALRPAERAVD